MSLAICSFFESTSSSFVQVQPCAYPACLCPCPALSSFALVQPCPCPASSLSSLILVQPHPCPASSLSSLVLVQPCPALSSLVQLCPALPLSSFVLVQLCSCPAMSLSSLVLVQPRLCPAPGRLGRSQLDNIQGVPLNWAPKHS